MENDDTNVNVCCIWHILKKSINTVFYFNHRGNYEMFLDMYEMKRSSANKDYEKYMKEIKRAKASGSKANQEKVKNKQKHNQKAKDKGNDVDRSDAAGDFQPSKWHDYSVRFEFPEPTELSPPLIQIIDVEFQYPNREDFKLEKVRMNDFRFLHLTQLQIYRI